MALHNSAVTLCSKFYFSEAIKTNSTNLDSEQAKP